MTQAWTITDENGNVIIPSVLTSNIEDLPQNAGIEWLQSYQAVPLAFEPDPARHKWDLNTLSWVDDMEQLCSRKCEQVNIKKDKVRYGGCNTPKGRMQSDATSQIMLNGAVSMALIIGESFNVDWTMEDNSVVSHNSEEIIAAGLAMGQFYDQCQQVSTSLKNAINQCITTAELDAIDIEGANWP